MSSTTPAYQFPAPLTVISTLNRTSSGSICCFCARHEGRGGSRWEGRTRNSRPRFEFAEEFRAKGVEKGTGFKFGDGAKKRTWWSDDGASGDYGFEDKDEDFGGFAALDGSIAISWIFKLLKAFGWMVPAVMISMFFGGNEGSNTMLMALALPLAQSAFSLLIDTFSGGTPSHDGRRPKSTRTKKQRPHPSANVRRRGVEQKVNNEKEVRTEQPFGGWDEI